MTTMAVPTPNRAALSLRLSGLAALSAEDGRKLADAERDQRHFPARRELVAEGEPIRERRAFLSGWACRQRILRDGRRQILNVLLPGDLIGVCRHPNPLAAASVLAVTDVTTCAVPDAEGSSGLSEAYARSMAIEERHMLAQITRIGRMDAYERLADWLLETRDRLALVGLASGDQFALPITQEMLADALGLTSVHVNRMLRALHRDGLVHVGGRTVSLLNRERLETLTDHRPVRVSSDD